MVDPIKIIQKHYDPESKAYHILVEHSKRVTKKALEIAEKVKNLDPDIKFIQEAGMLHDIGIFLTDAPELGCSGKRPYICHGYLGREILEKEGLTKHAPVCERHTGTGITLKEIKEKNLPLPKREMVPISIEEQIICYADKFFSKSSGKLFKEKSIEEIKKQIAKFGEEGLKKFESWEKLFGK